MDDLFAEAMGAVSLSKGFLFSVLRRLGEAGSRPCQNKRGEFVELLPGEESNGEDSPLKREDCRC